MTFIATRVETVLIVCFIRFYLMLDFVATTADFQRKTLILDFVTLKTFDFIRQLIYDDNWTSKLKMLIFNFCNPINFRLYFMVNL